MLWLFLYLKFLQLFEKFADRNLTFFGHGNIGGHTDRNGHKSRLGVGILTERILSSASEKAFGKAAESLGEDGFASAGSKGIGTPGRKAWKGTRCGIGSVDEVKVNADGSFSYIRRLNGDQDHQGRHVRISVGDYKTLYVRLYEYQ